MYVALAPLTDKMDTKYIIPSESARSHDDAHPKKKMLAILDFGENSFLMPLMAARITLLALICILSTQYGAHVLCHHSSLSGYVLHCNSMYSTVLRPVHSPCGPSNCYNPQYPRNCNF